MSVSKVTVTDAGVIKVVLVGTQGPAGTSPVFSGATLTIGAPLSIPNATPSVFAWDTIVEEVSEWVNLVSDNTSLIVPVGVSRIDIQASVVLTGVIDASTIKLEILKDGLVDLRVNQRSTVQLHGSTTGDLSASIQVLALPVSAGDTFQLRITQTSTAARNAAALTTWFATRKTQ